MGEGQNFSRLLMESPANVMTPTRFAQMAEDYLGKLDKVTVHVRYVYNSHFADYFQFLIEFILFFMAGIANGLNP